MCGIIYVNRKDKKPAYKAVLKRYRKQRSRGTDGFGYVAIRDNKVEAYRRSPTESEIIALLAQETAPEILFHHRFPTSTPNIEESAHPLLIENSELMSRSYLMVHNGVISNTDELQGKHEEMGFKYTTEIKRGFKTSSGKEYVEDYDWNDSESVLTETALVLEGKKTTIDAIGSAAVIGLQLNGDEVVGRFFFRNNRNPLVYNNNEHMTTLTSEGPGTTIGTDYLYLLTDLGGYTAHPALIEPPASYKPFTPTTPSAGYGAHYNTTRDNADEWDGWPKSHSAALPPASAAARGFRETLTDQEKADRAAAAAAEFDKDEYGLNEEEDRDFGMPNVKKIGELLAFSGSITYLGDKLIWTEYARVMESREEVEQAIREMDQYVNDINEMDDETIAARLELDELLIKLKKYEEDLEKEITKRETLKKRAIDQSVEAVTAPIVF